MPITQNVAHGSVKRLRMRDEDLTVICDRTKRKMKPEFQLGRFLWKKNFGCTGAYCDMYMISINDQLDWDRVTSVCLITMYLNETVD